MLPVSATGGKFLYMRIVAIALLILTLAACVSAPKPGHQNTVISDTLRLCSGLRISNAPAADNDNNLLSYSTRAQIAGVSLYRAPVNACVSSGYGPRRGGAGPFHRGVDLYTGNSKPIYAGGDGIVEDVKTMRGYGKTVTIRHNKKLITRYAHLSRYASGLRTGDRVVQGQHIGNTGETGNATAVHLHYEVWVNGKAKNPLTMGR